MKETVNIYECSINDIKNYINKKIKEPYIVADSKVVAAWKAYDQNTDTHYYNYYYFLYLTGNCGDNSICFSTRISSNQFATVEKQQAEEFLKAKNFKFPLI